MTQKNDFEGKSVALHDKLTKSQSSASIQGSTGKIGLRAFLFPREVHIHSHLAMRNSTANSRASLRRMPGREITQHPSYEVTHEREVWKALTGRRAPARPNSWWLAAGCRNIKYHGRYKTRKPWKHGKWDGKQKTLPKGQTTAEATGSPAGGTTGASIATAMPSRKSSVIDQPRVQQKIQSSPYGQGSIPTVTAPCHMPLLHAFVTRL